MTNDDQARLLALLASITMEVELENFRIVCVGAAVEDVLGYSVEDCQASDFSFDVLSHPDDADRLVASVVQAFEDGRAEIQFRARHQDGTIVPFYAVIAPDPAAEEPRFGVLLVRSGQHAIDASVSEDRLQLALESAEMGVWDWNVLEASIYWSDELYRLHGCKPEEVGDLFENYTTLVERIHPEDINAVQQIVINSLRTGDDYDIEYRFRMPDDSYRWLYVKGRMYIDSDGNPIRVAGTAQDVTTRKAAEIAAARELEERKRAEAELTELTRTLEYRVRARTEELQSTNDKLKAEVSERARAERDLARANRRLVQSNRELQDFAYVASHDLKEPLRKIATFADLMRVDCQTELGPTGLYYIDRMQDSAGRMTSLITDLLDFSRVKTRTESFSPVDLNEVVNNVLADLDVSITEAKAKISVAELPVLRADPTQMRQLFQNLISNALKFRRADAQPAVTICVEDAGNGSGTGDDTIRIVVEDNGIGFDDKYADRVFAPFQRLQKSYEGTGIGLAICRRIVERHHGSISVTSKPGRGTRFSIGLPREQPEEERDGDSN